MKARDLVLGRYLFLYCNKTREFQWNGKIVSWNLLFFHIFSRNRNVKFREKIFFFVIFQEIFTYFFSLRNSASFFCFLSQNKFSWINAKFRGKVCKIRKKTCAKYSIFCKKIRYLKTLNKTPCKYVAYYCIYTLCIYILY